MGQGPKISSSSSYLVSAPKAWRLDQTARRPRQRRWAIAKRTPRSSDSGPSPPILGWARESGLTRGPQGQKATGIGDLGQRPRGFYKSQTWNSKPTPTYHSPRPLTRWQAPHHQRSLRGAPAVMKVANGVLWLKGLQVQTKAPTEQQDTPSTTSTTLTQSQALPAQVS